MQRIDNILIILRKLNYIRSIWVCFTHSRTYVYVREKVTLIISVHTVHCHASPSLKKFVHRYTWAGVSFFSIQSPVRLGWLSTN